jgi:hypothetical protein
MHLRFFTILRPRYFSSAAVLHGHLDKKDKTCKLYPERKATCPLLWSVVAGLSPQRLLKCLLGHTAAVAQWEGQETSAVGCIDAGFLASHLL